jgi:para-aminobenzoate synthetase component 2
MNARVFVLDNYDSFTWNLVQAFAAQGALIHVARNDEVTIESVRSWAPSHVVISPGPGAPAQAGISKALVANLAGEVPLLGVCLGHQAIVETFGGKIVRAPIPVHGKSARIDHDGEGVFSGLAQGFEAGRYHSLVADRASLPAELQVTATVGTVIMGVRHRTCAVEGVQFHPESILTPHGSHLIANFLRQEVGAS